MTRPVLIVEDDIDLLFMFKTIIQRSISADLILTANGGEEGVALLAEHVPSVIVLDLAMPHINGNDVIHYILSDPRLDESRIIVVTAVPMRLSVEGLARVSAVLTKPVSPRELDQIVNHFAAEMSS